NEALQFGGGIYFDDTSPNMTSVSISGNTAANGGGLYIFESNPNISNADIMDNLASSSGGGAYITASEVAFNNTNIISNNSAGDGGAISAQNSNLLMDSCLVELNSTITGNGLGAFLSNTTGIVKHSTFSSNQVTETGYGGALYLTISSPSLEDNIFINNIAGEGGAICLDNSSPIVMNNVFAYNSCEGWGGAIKMNGGSSPQITNNTIFANTAGTSGGGIYASYANNTITNNIIFGNESLDMVGHQVALFYSNATNFFYNDIEGGLAQISSNVGFSGLYDGNIDLDPMFMSSVDNDFYLQNASPCIDSGHPDLNGDGDIWDIDPDDQDPDGTRMDMGAYYLDQTNFSPQISISPDSLGFTLNIDEEFEQSQALTISNFGLAPLEVEITINSDTIVTDIDGNIYPTVQIGDQVWMAENLKVTHYRNGTSITNVTDDNTWGELTTEAYCIYNNNASDEVDTYGALYNWYAVTDAYNIAPEGWHVPTDAEWKELEMALGMSQSEADAEFWRGTNEGSKLAGITELWNDGVLEDDSEFGSSGFTALPGGYRGYLGEYFADVGENAMFWSATESDNYIARWRKLDKAFSTIYRDVFPKRNGYSVRCIRDLPATAVEMPHEKNDRTLVGNLVIQDAVERIEESQRETRESWITTTPTELTIPPGESADVTVTVSAEGMDLGDYSDMITIISNDSTNSTIEVPVSMSVIFQDITPPTVELDTPDTLSIGEVTQLTWQAEDNSGFRSHHLFFSSETGQEFAFVDSVDGSSATYAWTVPNVISETARLSILSYDLVGLTGTDTTDIFVIIDEIELPLYGIWHVAVTGSNETGDGSPEAPFATIQFGIVASQNGDTVLVHPGTYIENINFSEKDIIVTSLAITTGDTSYISGTIIDGDQNGSVVTITGGESEFAQLYGFTIQNGGGWSTRGGGIYCSYSSPILDHLVIKNNRMPDESWTRGGGIYCQVASPLILNSIIHDNSSNGWGGGFFCEDYSVPIISNTVIYDNVAEWSGGGVVCGNYSELTMINVTISGNTATDNGGAVECMYHSELNIVNSILWNNEPQEILLSAESAVANITHSAILGGLDSIVNIDNGVVNWLSGNLSLNPSFVNPASSNYQLSDDSPCIGSGIDSVQIGEAWYYVPATDLDGNPRPRPFGTTPDMGAFENQTAINRSLWIVSTDGSDDDGDGSEESPFATIQFGIDASQTNDTVLVLPGTYVENINYNGKNVVLGSLTLISGDTSYISQTIIDGNESGSVVTFNSSEDTTSILNGFTVRNGSALAGGGVYCDASSPRLINLKISGNSASTFGGGIYSDHNGHPVVEGCEIVNNTAGVGGGIQCQNNSGITLNDVKVDSNQVTEYGGGIHMTWGVLSATNTSFNGNIVTHEINGLGGGIYLDGDGDYSFLNCAIQGNNVQYGGGGIYCNGSSPSLTNVLITNNIVESTDGAGSGIYGGLGSSSVLTNVTIANNWAPNSGAIIGFIEAVFINSIIWHNSPSTISNVTASFCNIEDRTPGVGNLNTDPLFVDMYNQDYHLSNSSPCIGTGIVEGAPAVDLDGNIRPDPPGSVPDMGAYENPLFERISGNIYFTSTTGSDSSFGGLTDPFLTVGRGIEATWNGDTLIVYPGLYGENISINAMSIVLASQLLTTADTSYVSSTIIDGNVSFDGDVDSTALFTGFTIQNGSIGISCLGDPVLSHLNIRGHTNVGISFSESDVSILHSVLNGNGRGIVAIGSELSLYNVDIKNNITSQRGAGIYLSGSTITMDSVEITDNLTTNGQGGGIYITSSTLVMTQSAVVGNTSENSNGGGIFITNGSSINLDNVTVSNNQADELGGGLFVGIDLNSSLIATNTSINNNVCNDYGGGIYIRGVDDFVLSQSRVQGNTVNRRGGGIYIRDAHPILTNVLISDNEVTGTEPDDGGGGIYLIDSNADPILTNVTIANNIANAGGGIYRYDLDCEPTFTNSIVWNNTPDSYNTSNGSMITYSNIEGGVPGGGNINIDPLFVDTLAGDYNLLENSPCIDTGDPDLDEDGDTWEMDPDDQDPDETRMDMGAFYYHQYYTGPVWHVSMEGSDDTGDGSVDNPFASIQHGINLANDLDTILVRPGTFNENIDYISKRLVIGSLFLTTQDTAYISQTVINGNGNDVVIIEEVDFTILSGFTLINGNAGVKIRNSNPSLNNLVIYDMSGAVPIGVRIEYDATVQLTDTEIFNNRIGILVLSTGELIGENLLIHDNTNEFDGGAGLYVNSNAGSDIPAIASLTRSVLFGNAGTNSGAIQNEGQLWLDNVTISQNTGTNADASGGIWQATMLDNIPEPGQEAVLHMRNTIIFDNIPAENYAIQDNNDFRPTCWDLDYNNIEINTFPDHCDYDIGENNQYNIDPVFSDEGSNDFYLLANSPCIDSGDPDLDGDTDTWETDPDDQDPDGTRMDMGAYYYHQLPAYEGPVWHISTEGSDETGNGSEDAPFASIQFGIDASQSNDTVLVLPGTYVETINYNGKNVVLGSLTLITGDTSYISQTIIDGDQASSVVTFGSAEDSTAVLLGFTIRNGRALNGGGIICYNTSPQIVSCRISGNTATSFGGGLCFDVNSKARIENCLIDSNDATLGGGVFCEINSDIKITDVIIRGNVATNLGGGFYCTEANPTFERVLVEGNIANAYGGVYFHGTESIETFLNKVTIVDNVAVTGGGLNSSHANTILTVNNCIIWGNSPDQVYEELGSLTINYSDVQNGWTGEGNIDEDPLFVNAADSDYRLQSDSPCIDTGNPTSPLDPDDTRADMGAYYFHQSIEEYDVPEPIWIDIINSTDSYSYQPSDAIQTSDRGLLVLGSIYDDSGTTDTDIFVKKYHPMGEINWTWQYYGPEQDRPVAFVEADSGNLFILSTTYITGENNFDFRLIKLDSDGNNIWNISYGASENEQGCDLVSVDDGVVVLYEYSSTINLSDLMVKKVDSDGNEVWERIHSGPGMNWGYSIIRTSDGGFAVLSNSSSNGAGGERPYFLKLDSSGYEEWSESYGVEDSSFVLDLIQLEENYILSGKIYDATQTGSKGWLLKIGEEGDVLWDRKYRLGEHIEFHSIDKCDDDGFLITGFGADELFDTLYTPLLKTTSEGNLEWVTTELFDQNNWGARAIQTADNGYFAIGWIHPDPTDVNVWAIRFEGELDVLPPQVSLQTSADLEQVVNGELVMIRWMAVDNFGLNWAKLFFTSDGGATFTFLDSVDANLSELEWVAPDIISNDCKFAIWVSDLAGNISADTLIGSFSINDGTLPLISIVNPTQTTTVREHDTLFVSWEASDNIGIEWFELWYSNNPSEPFENLVQISFDDTSFAFGIGDGVSDSARIKMDVMDVAGNTAEDISEYFSVTDNTSPVISFFSIPDTVEWGIGSIMDISVVASDNVEVTGLDLNYTIDAGATWIPIVQDLYPVEGRPTYSWLIPDAPGNCQIKAIVRDAVGLTDIAYSDIFSIIIEYPRLIANLAQITPLGTINVRFSQLMDSLDISAGTQVIGTIAGSYDIEGSVSGEDVSISTPQGFVSLDTLMIVFFAQDWTNRLGYGLDGNGNGSFEGSPVDNDTVLVHITPAGDYNQDYIFNFDDFSDFVLAWHADYFPYELAPNTYEIPYISIQPDSIFNIFDLATFASMWNWSVGIEQVPPVIDGFHLVSLEAIQEGNQLTVVLDKEEYLATQTIIKYDPSIVAIDIQNQGLAKVSASSMVFVDTNPDSGYILITSSQLTESNDMLLQLQLSPSTRQKYSIEVAVQGTQEDGNVTQKRTSIDLIPIPTTYSLSQNYPNPFNASTTIEYGLPKDSDMSISIYDIRGRFVRDIYSGEKQAGYHVTQWNGLNDGGHGVSSGLYFIVLSTPDYRIAKKALILK
ncbi:right-handed parallel beta-helix repeat-containing protein, partial [bacterium]|nr:right-handed parallel beta-helix repeat-containing protein [bacterium]